MSRRIGDVKIVGGRMMYRNFSGKAGAYNAEGQRNFCVLLDDELANRMAKDGWNVKYLEPRDETEGPQPYIQVKCRFDNFPPKVVLVTSRGKSIMNDETISNLDYADIKTTDMVITPYEWDMNGKTGITAYLKTLYVVLEEDEFEAKYFPDTAPDSAMDAIGGCGRCEECDGHCQGY